MLVNTRGHVKLCDFGVSTQVHRFVCVNMREGDGDGKMKNRKRKQLSKAASPQPCVICVRVCVCGQPVNHCFHFQLKTSVRSQGSSSHINSPTSIVLQPQKKITCYNYDPHTQQHSLIDMYSVDVGKASAADNSLVICVCVCERERLCFFCSVCL